MVASSLLIEEIRFRVQGVHAENAVRDLVEAVSRVDCAARDFDTNTGAADQVSIYTLPN